MSPYMHTLLALVFFSSMGLCFLLTLNNILLPLEQNLSFYCNDQLTSSFNFTVFHPIQFCINVFKIHGTCNCQSDEKESGDDIRSIWSNLLGRAILSLRKWNWSKNSGVNNSRKFTPHYRNHLLSF